MIFRVPGNFLAFVGLTDYNPINLQAVFHHYSTSAKIFLT
jgi:hypothetical protein